MSDSTAERKLPPSAEKLRQARRRGQVATSRDFSMALGMLAATGALVGTGSVLLTRLTQTVSQGIMRVGQTPTRDLTAEDLMPLLIAGGTLIAMTAGPIALAAAGSGVMTTLVQTKFNLSTQKLKLHWERLSPSHGLQKLKPSQAGIDTLKTLITGGVLAYLAWRLGKEVMIESSRLIWSAPLTSMGYGWQETLRLLWHCSVALLVLGAADIGLQKWRHTESLKMTLQEVKEEHKALEGKPEVKQKIAQIRRALFRKRMMNAVPTATVIITNPTHFAVALEYNREKNPAPVVVAKGADLVAAKIREIGRSHSVPIIENPPLARALFKECELGDTIPGPLFNAVAEVLAYLIRIKQLVL